MIKDLVSVKRALISVSDKTDIDRLAKSLVKRGVEILSTGGTADFLRQNSIPVTDVSKITNFPELMDGRIKTLHPKIHGGLLGIRDNENHTSSMKTHNIPTIDLIIINLYPFERIKNKNVSSSEIIENIDIGGPAMIRSGAKNHKYVSVIVDQEDYTHLIDELEENSGSTTGAFRRNLAEIAFARTAEYDGFISQWLNQLSQCKQPRRIIITGQCKKRLRYGENPHQVASYYQTNLSEDILSASKIHHGKELSYNNLNDLNAAVELIREFEYESKALAVIIKHSNPCGVALKDNLLEAYLAAYNCDRLSAFGGIIAFNVNIDKMTAEAISKNFTEIVIAPSADEDAIAVFSKKRNLRLITLSKKFFSQTNENNFRQISGGLLLQDKDSQSVTEDDISIVSNKKPIKIELEDMLFAWKVAKHVKSNAIVYAKNSATVGIGAGQMSRVDSAKIAKNKAAEISNVLGLNKIVSVGAVAASDAFFPFPDSIHQLADAGISAVIQPGGSVKDSEVIGAINECDMSMIFTHIRHFKH